MTNILVHEPPKSPNNQANHKKTKHGFDGDVGNDDLKDRVNQMRECVGFHNLNYTSVLSIIQQTNC